MPRKPRQKNIPSSTPIRRSGTIRASLVEETGNGKDDGRIWLSRISKTQRQRENLKNGTKEWRMYRRWYESDMWATRENIDGGSEGARDAQTVNTLGSIAMTYMPFLINGNIKAKLKAQKPADVVSAQIQEALLNYEWRERNMTAPVKRIVQDVVVIGHGIGRTGYVVEVDEGRKKSDGEIEYSDYVRTDAATLDYVDPLDFLFDLSGKDRTLHTARWCAECTYAPYADVMANPRYDAEVLAQIQTGAYPMATRSGYEGAMASNSNSVFEQSVSALTPEDTLVPIWKIWDKKFRKTYEFAENVPEPLTEESWPYDYLDGFPYVKIDFIPANNRSYGMGIFKLAEDQALQLNRVRTQMVAHARSNKRAFGALPDVDPGEITKFTDGPDGVVVTLPRPDAIAPIKQDSQMLRELLDVEGRLQADIERLTGADALLQGGQLPSRTTGVEVTTRANITRLKAEDRVWAVEQGVVELMRQVLQHLKANRIVDDVIEIVGAQGAFWQTYTHNDIQAETDVSVEYFSAPKYDPAVSQQQRMQVFQIATQALPVLQQMGAPQTIDLVELMGWVLRGFDEQEIGRFFKPALIPLAPLEEVTPGAGQAAAGQMAPQPIPTTPGNGAPPEGLSMESLLMQLQGQTGQPGSLPQM